jgi:Protein of unknown function (DUF2442)
MELLRKRTNRHSVLTTDEEIDAAIAKAAAIVNEPRVVQAAYVSAEGLDSLVLKMSDNRRKLIPREEIQGLSNAPLESLNDIEISPSGTSLRWPSLDVDLYVPPLLEGIVGTREWMKHLGRQGGSATTLAKGRASRLNGLKGGRPRKRIGKKKDVGVRSNRVRRNTLDDLNYVLFESRPRNVTSPDIFKQYQALHGQGQVEKTLHGQDQLGSREEGTYAAVSNNYL